MGRIEACPIPPPPGLPEIEPFEIAPLEDPLPFRNREEFERFLCDVYIFRTTHSTTFHGRHNVECLGIFSPNESESIERCCLQYASHTEEYPTEFECFLIGKITSHNHPSGQTFSRSDIVTWADLPLQEIRVVAPYNVGAYRTYSIKRLNQRRPTWAEMKCVINAQDWGLHNFDSNPNYRHRCFLLLHEMGFFEYSVDPPIQM